MRKRLTALLAAVAMLLAAVAEARAADIYVVGDDASLGKIDSATLAYTSIRTGLNPTLTNLAWNPNAGDFFTSEYRQDTFGTISTTGSVTPLIVSSVGRFSGLAYDSSNSILYAFNAQNISTGIFGTINPADGAFTSITATDAGLPGNGGNGGALALHNGTFYITSSSAGTSRFGTIDSGTGLFTEIATDSKYFGMNLTSDGSTLYAIYGSGSGKTLATITPATGAITDLGTITGADDVFEFYGAAIVPVPEPSTYVLGTLAACSMG